MAASASTHPIIPTLAAKTLHRMPFNIFDPIPPRYFPDPSTVRAGFLWGITCALGVYWLVEPLPGELPEKGYWPFAERGTNRWGRIRYAILHPFSRYPDEDEELD